MSDTIGERHASACRYKNEIPEGSRRSARQTRFRPREVYKRIESMIDDKQSATDFVSDESPHFSAEQPPQEFAAWEEVDKGRFMPRRVRGSNPGRALG